MGWDKNPGILGFFGMKIPKSRQKLFKNSNSNFRPSRKSVFHFSLNSTYAIYPRLSHPKYIRKNGMDYATVPEGRQARVINSLYSAIMCWLSKTFYGPQIQSIFTSVLSDFSQASASMYDIKTAAQPFDTIHDILRSLSLLQSLLKGRNSPNWRIGNRGVKFPVLSQLQFFINFIKQ